MMSHTVRPVTTTTTNAIATPPPTSRPVDVRIPGCPPAPEAIAEAILRLVDGEG